MASVGASLCPRPASRSIAKEIRALAARAPASISIEPPRASQMPVAWSGPPCPATAGGSLISCEATITTAAPAITSERPRGASAMRARPVSSPASSRTAASASGQEHQVERLEDGEARQASSYQSSMRLTARRIPPTAPSRGPTEMREPLDMPGLYDLRRG